MSIRTLSFPPIGLSLHLRFLFLGNPTGSDWTDIAAVLVLPVFRHPIKLYLGQIHNHDLLDHAVSSCEQNPDIKRLLEDGHLVIIKGEPEAVIDF